MADKKTRFTQAIWKVTQALRDADNLDNALAASLEAIIEALNSEAGTIWLLNKQSNRLIPMFNHDEENIRKTAEFCVSVRDAVTLVQLLPYHNMGVMKYLRISDKPVMEATPPTDEYMN